MYTFGTGGESQSITGEGGGGRPKIEADGGGADRTGEWRQMGQTKRDRWDRRSGTDETDEAGQMRQTKRGRWDRRRETDETGEWGRLGQTEGTNRAGHFFKSAGRMPKHSRKARLKIE